MGQIGLAQFLATELVDNGINLKQPVESTITITPLRTKLLKLRDTA